jgi:hypothetical protein
MKKIYTQKEIDEWESSNDPIMNSLWYRNRPGIRRSGVNIKITNQEMVTLYEYNRNPVSFIHAHGIVYPGGNKCKPILHQTQEKILMDHNLKKLLDRGVLVTINSDDPAYFGGYMNENFSQTAMALNLSQSELKLLAINSFKASFLPVSTKESWIEKIHQLSL